MGENFEQNQIQALNQKVEIEYFTLFPDVQNQIIQTVPEIHKEVSLADKIKSAQKGGVIKLKYRYISLITQHKLFQNHFLF